MKVNAAGMRQRNANMERQRQESRVAGLQALVRPALSRAVMAAPRDTNRYVRAWIQAGNQAGVLEMAVPPVRESRFVEQNEERLKAQELRYRRQLDRAKGRWIRWQNIVIRRYEAVGRTRGRWYQDAKNKLRKAEQDYQQALKVWTRASEELDKLQSHRGQAIVIFGNSKKRSLTITVRPKVYGGTGRVYSSPDRAVMVLHNREPHASIVESRSVNQSLRFSLNQMGKLGLTRMRGVFGRKLLGGSVGKGGGVPVAAEK